MTKRTVTILAAVFVALVGLIALSRLLGGRTALPTRPPVDLAVEESAVDRLTVASREGTLTLVKLAGSWRLGEGSAAATAAPGQVKALFDALKGARFERLVARKPKDLKTYGLDAGAVRLVVLKSADTTRLAFRLGSTTEVPGADYLQAEGDEAVWVVSGDLRALTDPNPEPWRAKAPGPASAEPTGPAGQPPSGAATGPAGR